MSDAERVRKREFARILGVSPSYVTKLAKAGRLVIGEDGLVDVAASLARIEATRDPARQDVAERHARVRAAKAGATPEAPAVEADATPASYAEARALKERYAALTAKLEYERLAGRLVDVEDVRAAGAEAGATLRAALEALPDQLAPLLAAERDEHRVHALLVEYLETAMRDVADALARAAREEKSAA